MKITTTNAAVATNKSFAIRRHQDAIRNASNLLVIPGNEPAYYDWHRRIIKENENAIKAILDDSDTNWN